MRGHNVCFYAELTKIIPIDTKYSLLSRALGLPKSEDESVCYVNIKCGICMKCGRLNHELMQKIMNSRVSQKVKKLGF